MTKGTSMFMVLVLGAALGAAGTYFTHSASIDSASESHEPPVAALPTQAAAPDTKPEEPAAVIKPVEPVRARNFNVCNAGTTLPTLQRLKLSDTDADVWAVHCGQRVELFTLDGDADSLTPRRIASMSVTLDNPKLTLRSAPLLATDLSADGKRDLLLPVRAHDETGAPRGGALYELVRDAHGGFGNVTMLSTSPTVALASGHFMSAEVTDLALVALEDPRVAIPSELVVIHGGPAPVKVGSAKLGVDARSAVALDLDLDSRDELVITSAQPTAELIAFDVHGTVAARTPWEIPGAKETLAADIDGDGHDDAVIVGDALSYVRANAQPSAPQALPESAKLQAVSASDVNADGKVDFVAYSAPNVVALEQHGLLAFERKTLCALAVSEVTPLSVYVAAQDAQHRLTLIVLAMDAATPAHARIGFVDCSGDQAQPWQPQAAEIADAPLHLHFDLH